MKLKSASVLISLAITLSASSLFAGEVMNDASPSLPGSWQFTLRPISPTAVALVPIEALATFTTDGSVVETDSSEAVPTLTAAGNTIYGTPAHGIWQPAPAVGFLFIRFTSLLVNQNGTLHARKIVTISGALDSTGNNFKGNYGFELIDRSGNVIGSGSGTVKGQRIVHPLLP